MKHDYKIKVSSALILLIVLLGNSISWAGINRPVLDFKGDRAHPSRNTTLHFSVKHVSAEEGTLMFWFRPDWSANDFTYHPLAHLTFSNGIKIILKKGYNNSLAPNHTYFVLKWPDGSETVSCASDTLFTARQWRHYVIRWSRSRQTMSFIVDGCVVRATHADIPPMSSGTPETVSMEFPDQARGAFAGVKLYNHYLNTKQLWKAAGITHPAKYLALQKPPTGDPVSRGENRARTWVNPATGQSRTVLQRKEAPLIYNPGKILDLPSTPHTNWARPLAGTKPRVLLVMKNDYYSRDSGLRAGIELWQRLGATIDIANKPSKKLFSRDYDVIVVSQQGRGKANKILGWPSLAGPLRQWILQRVQSGLSGLVLVYPTDVTGSLSSWLASLHRVSNRPVIRGFPAGAVYAHDLTRWNKVYDVGKGFYETSKGLDQAIECYRSRQSRVVKLNYHVGPWSPSMTLTPDTAANAAATSVEYDYWQALAARAILFAAGYSYPARIDSIQRNGNHWRITTAGAPAGSTLYVRGRDDWGRVYFQHTYPVTHNGIVNAQGKPLPPHAAIDAILRDKEGRVLDWYSVAVPTSNIVSLDNVTLSKPYYKKGDMIHGTAHVTCGSPGQCKLLVYLDDYTGRRLARFASNVELAKGEQAIPFDLTIPLSSDSLLMRVEATILHNGSILATRSADCPVPAASDKGYFPGMSAGAGNRFFVRVARRRMRDDYGMKLVMRGGRHSYGLAARENLRQVEYATHLGYPADEKTFDAWMKGAASNWKDFFPKHLRADMNKVRPYRPLFYSLGEEHYLLVRSSENPKALRRFRIDLREKYKGLNALNRAWGTHFTRWNEVKMLRSASLKKPGIHASAARLDNRQFMDHLFADKHAALADWFHEHIPTSQVGIHTGWGLWMGRGYDYWLLSRALNCMITYEGPMLQYARSFFKNCYGNWYHYKLGSIGNARLGPWLPVLSGARGVMFYSIGSGPWGALAADLKLGSDFAASGNEYRAAGRVGQLLSRMTYQDGQVAIDYSQDSYLRGVKNLSWIHQAFIDLLFDRGIPFKFYSGPQIAKGNLLKNHVKLLILPHSISLSDAEAEAIRKYVHAGGTVWADIEPGIYSDRGPKLKRPQLADLFDDLDTQTTDQGIVIHTGSFGNGWVILAPLKGFNYQRNIGNNMPAISILSLVISKADIHPVVHILSHKTQEPANGILACGYKRGNQRYIVAVKDYRLVDKNPSHVILRFNKPGYCYNIRSGTYLGYGKQFDQTLASAVGEAYALLPYRVQGIDVTTLRPAKRGHNLVLAARIKANHPIASDDLHLLSVTIHAPDGSEIISLHRLALLPGGEGEIRLPIAYDDAPGKWTVMLRDVATGVTAKYQYSLPAIKEVLK